MPPYTIMGDADTRVLTILANCALRYRFWHKDGLEQVVFKPSGPRLIACTIGPVMVYKKPNAMQYHKEYMIANARAMWLGLQSDSDRLLDNMLEYVETI